MSNGRIFGISAAESARWQSVLDRVVEYDFYHLPAYHTFSEQQGEGEGLLVVYEEGDAVIALPLLIRPVANIPGLEEVGRGLRDATSVYGYPGPVVNAAAHSSIGMLDRFAQSLSSFAVELGIVSVFSRLNPLLDNCTLMPESLGQLRALGKTISIDLSLPAEEQWAGYKRDTRYDIRKARRSGVCVFRDENWDHLDEFIDLYTETMQRVDANARYAFPTEYFVGLKQALGGRANLFVARHEDNICAASIFVVTGKLVQHHLAGNDVKYGKLDPAKVVIDEARLWGNELGARVLHLGGGVGSEEDGVFWQKSRFSPNRHQFFVWDWIVQAEAYRELVERRKVWLAAQGKEFGTSDRFPLYRVV